MLTASWRQAQQRLRELEDQKQLTIAKTTRKVQLLKAQFVEHKNKWEAVSAREWPPSHLHTSKLPVFVVNSRLSMDRKSALCT